MQSLKLTIAYDGTDFCGWQVQPNSRTVQGVLQEILGQITVEEVRQRSEAEFEVAPGLIPRSVDNDS